MGHLHKSIFLRPHEKIDVAGRAELVVFGKARKCDDLATGGARRLHRIEDIRRTARTADRDQKIAGTPMKLDLAGKYIFIAEVIAKTGQRRWIVEGHGAQTAIFRKIYRQMTANAGAAAIAHE